MDFFAQIYNTDSRLEGPHGRNSPLQSPRTQHEGVCQGYGSEANAHLRRASSGLESDMAHARYHSVHSHDGHHGANVNADINMNKNYYEHNTASSHNTPLPATNRGSDFSYFSLGTNSPASHDPHRHAGTAESPRATSPVAAPSLHRRTSVSNPCLLHHTNSNGSGVVRPPVMPHTLSSPQINDSLGSLQQHQQDRKSAMHEPTITEGRELRF